MKILAPAVAVVIVLAVPAIGETAQKKKSKVRKPAITSQTYIGEGRTNAGTPCVGYTWRGCLVWDPDPNVRSMLERDRGKDP